MYDALQQVLPRLKHLTHLDLSRNELSNWKNLHECIKELTKLQQLERLDLYDHTIPYDEPQITKAGVAELKKALPNCAILGP